MDGDLCPDWAQAESRESSWNLEEEGRDRLGVVWLVQEKVVSVMCFPWTRARRAKAEDAVIITKQNKGYRS